MREALAQSDLDFVLREPDGGRVHTGEGARLPKILRMACISTAAVMCGVILVNALFLQEHRHPAPLLRVPSGLTTAGPQEAVAPVPTERSAASLSQTQAAPAASARTARDPIADELAKSALVERKASKVPVTASSAAPKGDVVRADPIAGLIGGTEPTPSAEPSPTVFAAQKALLRLGYVLRADGVMGATTKQAIEHYERDTHATPRGELTPKLSRELAAKSGVPGQ